MSKNSRLRVVCFGDSITGSRPREAYRHHFLKFSDLLQLMLEARLGIGTVEVLNRGFAGQTSSDGLARLQEDVLDEHPDIAIVLLGGNDQGGAQIDASQTRQNLHAILGGIREEDIKVLALQYHLLPGDQPATAWHHLVANNETILEVATLHTIPTLNMRPVMEAASETVPREELVNAEDGVHLNPGGELVFARAVFQQLDELGWLDQT